MKQRRKWTEAQLIEAAKSARSIAEVLKGLNLVASGGNYVHIKRCMDQSEIDYSHFSGQAWRKDRKFSTPRIKLEHKLKENSYTKTSRLRAQLISSGILLKACSSCGLTEWMGRDIPLELDHINGRNDDNRIENLRLLCPNCHALTDTYCGKNIGKYRNS